jgi:PleD family two-component response regulator
LKSESYKLRLSEVKDPAELVDKINNSKYDAVIAAYSFSKINYTKILRELKKINSNITFMIISDPIGETKAKEWIISFL